MSDITINSNENQEDNQKTTPVTGSLSGQKEVICSLPNAIINSWLASTQTLMVQWPAVLPFLVKILSSLVKVA